MKRYMSKFSVFNEDSSGKWGEVKKEAVPFMAQFSKCEINYKEYGKSNLDVSEVKFKLTERAFTSKLKEGKFEFILNDTMSATLYTDEVKGLKVFKDDWELYIIVE